MNSTADRRCGSEQRARIAARSALRRCAAGRGAGALPPVARRQRRKRHRRNPTRRLFRHRRPLVRPSRRGQLHRRSRARGKEVENFGHEAGDAAEPRSTAPRTPPTRSRACPARASCRGHEKCKIAPNGAPDCVAAADRDVQDQGLRHAGKSLDMTTAEVCPRAGLSGRPQTRAGLQDRDLRLPRALPIAPRGCLTPPRACVSVAPIASGSAGEPSCQACSNAKPPAGRSRSA